MSIVYVNRIHTMSCHVLSCQPIPVFTWMIYSTVLFSNTGLWHHVAMLLCSNTGLWHHVAMFYVQTLVYDIMLLCFMFKHWFMTSCCYVVMFKHWFMTSCCYVSGRSTLRLCPTVSCLCVNSYTRSWRL